MQQKIIIKKLPAHPNSNTCISEKFTDEEPQVNIPEGWKIVQMQTTPIHSKVGETKYLAITLLLEKD